jgi:hypothetical protein
MRLGPKGATVSDRMDPYAGGQGSRALVAWLVVAGTGLLLIALGNEAMDSWSARLGDQGSVTFANGAAGTGTWKRQPKVDPGAGASDRTRSRVLIERRSHSEDECAPFGRVPIAVMIACHQRDQSMNAGLTDMREIKHQMRRARFRPLLALGDRHLPHSGGRVCGRRQNWLCWFVEEGLHLGGTPKALSGQEARP